MIAKMIQLSLAKAMTISAMHALATPVRMVARSPGSFTAGPGRKAWARI